MRNSERQPTPEGVKYYVLDSSSKLAYDQQAQISAHSKNGGVFPPF